MTEEVVDDPKFSLENKLRSLITRTIAAGKTVNIVVSTEQVDNFKPVLLDILLNEANGVPAYREDGLTPQVVYLDSATEDFPDSLTELISLTGPQNKPWDHRHKNPLVVWLDPDPSIFEQPPDKHNQAQIQKIGKYCQNVIVTSNQNHEILRGGGLDGSQYSKFLGEYTHTTYYLPGKKD